MNNNCDVDVVDDDDDYDDHDDHDNYRFPKIQFPFLEALK